MNYSLDKKKNKIKIMFKKKKMQKHHFKSTMAKHGGGGRNTKIPAQTDYS